LILKTYLKSKMSYVFKAGLQGEGVGVKVMRVIGG
jgi:hypothetical protein